MEIIPQKVENRNNFFYVLCVMYVHVRGGLGRIHLVISCNTTHNLARFCYIRSTRVTSFNALHVSSFIRILFCF